MVAQIVAYANLPWHEADRLQVKRSELLTGYMLFLIWMHIAAKPPGAAKLSTALLVGTPVWNRSLGRTRSVSGGIVSQTPEARKALTIVARSPVQYEAAARSFPTKGCHYTTYGYMHVCFFLLSAFVRCSHNTNRVM